MRNLVLFGDSLTYGYGVFKKDNIASLIQNRFKKLSVINSGVNGDTTREALKRLNRDVISFSPVIATILFGSNDSAPSENAYRTIYEFNKNMRAIIDTIKTSKKGTEIILITPPPVDDGVFMPSTTNARLAPYCDAIREIAQRQGLFLCDLNKEFPRMSGGNIEPYIQEDGCHLTEKGYMAFYNRLEPLIAEITGE